MSDPFSMLVRAAVSQSYNEGQMGRNFSMMGTRNDNNFLEPRQLNFYGNIRLPNFGNFMGMNYGETVPSLDSNRNQLLNYNAIPLPAVRTLRSNSRILAVDPPNTRKRSSFPEISESSSDSDDEDYEPRTVRTTKRKLTSPSFDMATTGEVKTRKSLKTREQNPISSSPRLVGDNTNVKKLEGSNSSEQPGNLVASEPIADQSSAALASEPPTPQHHFSANGRSKTKTSQYLGVSFNKATKNWKAQTKFKGKKLFFGYFEQEIDAAHAYDRGVFKLKGPDAPRNFPYEGCPVVEKVKHSQYRGVTLDKRMRKWIAYIRYEGNFHHLGYFDNEMDAAKAFDKAALDKWGPKAETNFKYDTA